MQRLPRSACSAMVMLVLAGCSPSAPPASRQPQPSPPRSQTAWDDAAAIVLPDLMSLLVDPAAGVVLSAAEGHGVHDASLPTAEAWQAVVDAADQLAQTAERLAQPAFATGRADWLRWSAALRAGAVASATAAGRHDGPGLTTAGAGIRDACVACHARYAPEIRTPPPLHVPR